MNFMIRIRTLPIDTTRKDAKYAEEITTQQHNVFSKGEKLIRELLEISTQEKEVINQDIEDLTTDTRTEKGLDIREITTTTATDTNMKDENIEKEELEDMIDMMEKLDIKKENIENNKAIHVPMLFRRGLVAKGLEVDIKEKLAVSPML
ncbi:hypothetical protein RhiirA4_425786 [Rhizophagus irregularis]|uniref:Uncharacterized protein n=1 Tax=Rhizophagus irregularis TaxID=588596 RepID=A0A2I1H2L6_9GLOM|nr:hypothetical protein RhiirA4_425786 [Rhizophagus irregularis]